MESENEFASLLLEPLKCEPARPSTVDISRVVADGRRRRRRMAVAGTAGVVAVTVVAVGGGVAVVGSPGPSGDRNPAVAGSPPGGATVPSVPAAAAAVPVGCTINRLPVPAGQPPKSVVTGGDPSGRYLLGRSYPDSSNSHQVLIWDNGRPRTVPMPGDDQGLNDINSAGVAVGESYQRSDGPTAWLYRDATLTSLPGRDATAMGINERGMITGSVGDKPAMWSSAGAAPTMLKLPGPGWTGYAAGIDEDGTIVGDVQSGPAANLVGYFWHPDGSGEQLPAPLAGGKPVGFHIAAAIRNGWVAGWAALDIRTGRGLFATRWNLRAGTVEPAGLDGPAQAVNRDGWIVGSTRNWGATAVLLAGGRTIRLPTLGGTEDNLPSTISDDGTTIAGQTDQANGDPVAVVWHCR
jgi:uncharacterized membrane protein